MTGSGTGWPRGQHMSSQRPQGVRPGGHSRMMSAASSGQAPMGVARPKVVMASMRKVATLAMYCILDCGDGSGVERIFVFGLDLFEGVWM